MSDPTMERDTISVTVRGRTMREFSAADGLRVNQVPGGTRIDIINRHAYGRSLVATLRQRRWGARLIVRARDDLDPAGPWCQALPTRPTWSASMTGMEIFEDARVVSRADLAAWLRQLASQLESDGQIFYGAAGTVTVADQVHCELEIERKSGSEISVEIEFSWASPEAAEPAGTSGEADTTGEEEEEEKKEEKETGYAVKARTAAEAGVAGDTADSDAEPAQ